MNSFDDRLANLKNRRQGIYINKLLESVALDGRAPIREHYETLNESSGIRYAIGAMAPVSEEYTHISIREGQRVACTLKGLLETKGFKTATRLQGSVALNIHIKGRSDVDMLVLYESVYLTQTPKLRDYGVASSDPRSIEEIIRDLRNACEDSLVSRYHAADVDCSNNKSITVSGGSLQRQVDIVPSGWYHTHDYQRSGDEKDIGVLIYHKAKHELDTNYPFKHKFSVGIKDQAYNGNLKRVVRLLKNIVADMSESQRINAQALSSFDLTSIAYHMDMRLSLPVQQQLGLVEKTREFFEYLLTNEAIRSNLEVPDGTRKIFDAENKHAALVVILREIDDLAKQIAKELAPYSMLYNGDLLINKAIYGLAS